MWSTTYHDTYLNNTCHRVALVRWVTESLRPFSVAADRGFLELMKTGRPGYYVPSPSTVSRDVKVVFANTRSRLAKLLRVSEHYSRASMGLGMR